MFAPKCGAEEKLVASDDALYNGFNHDAFSVFCGVACIQSYHMRKDHSFIDRSGFHPLVFWRIRCTLFKNSLLKLRAQASRHRWRRWLKWPAAPCQAWKNCLT